jgi:hypothetical protein
MAASGLLGSWQGQVAGESGRELPQQAGALADVRVETRLSD